MSTRCGFSLIEVLIGIFLLVLLMVPLSTLMSQSSSQTGVSLHEIQAVGYVSELLDQITELARNDAGPKLDGLLKASGKPLPDLLEGLTPDLSDPVPNAMRTIQVGKGTTTLLVSPLFSPFKERFFRVSPLEAAKFTSFPLTRGYKVTAGVRWTPAGEQPGKALRTYEASVFLLEGS